MFKLNQSRNKRAIIASFDLLFSLIVIILILFPILNFTSYTTTLSHLNSQNAQKLSSLIQISESFYTTQIAEKSNSLYSQDTYSYSGILSDDFNPTKKYDFTYMGLTEFSIYTTPPPFSSSQQFCVNR